MSKLYAIMFTFVSEFRTGSDLISIFINTDIISEFRTGRDLIFIFINTDLSSDDEFQINGCFLSVIFNKQEVI